MLDPRPRDFTRAEGLSVEIILDALAHGRDGTAMRPFDDILPEDDLRAVAEFVHQEFVQKGAVNTYYHTAANGWPDHRERYGAAFPFATGALPADVPPATLSEQQRRGLRLFKDTCVTCHDTGRVEQAGPGFEKYPLSHLGCGVTCHEGRAEFPWERPQTRSETASQTPATPYDAHQQRPPLPDPTPAEARGESLYQKNCAFCHAPSGTGGNWIGTFLEPHARDLTDPAFARRMDRATLESVIRDGLEGTSMPAWGAVLDDSQIADVAVYVERVFLTPARTAAGGG